MMYAEVDDGYFVDYDYDDEEKSEECDCGSCFNCTGMCAADFR